MNRHTFVFHTHAICGIPFQNKKYTYIWKNINTSSLRKPLFSLSHGRLVNYWGWHVIFTLFAKFFFFKYWRLINWTKIFQCIKFLTERVNLVLQALENVLTPVVKWTKDKNTSCHLKIYNFFLFINKRCISNLLISRYASFSLQVNNNENKQ